MNVGVEGQYQMRNEFWENWLVKMHTRYDYEICNESDNEIMLWFI